MILILLFVGVILELVLFLALLWVLYRIVARHECGPKLRAIDLNHRAHYDFGDDSGVVVPKATIEEPPKDQLDAAWAAWTKRNDENTRLTAKEAAAWQPHDFKGHTIVDKAGNEMIITSNKATTWREEWPK